MKKYSAPVAILLAFAAPLWLAACDKDSGNDPVDSHIDITPDTFWDSDSVPDPSPDPTPDPTDTTDTSSDPITDDAPDSTGCVSGTASVGGICNIIDQCNCAPGSLCIWNVNTSTCQLYEECYATASGTIAVEAACNPATAGGCVPGSDCLSTDGVNGTCYQWCRDATDCSVAGRECAVPVSFTLASPCTGTATPPYLACTQGCPTDEDCDPFTAGPCGSGNSCMWDPTCNILECVPAGTAAAGAECTVVGCLPGAGCYTTTSVPVAHCYAYCDATHTCATGTCAALGYTGDPALGVCQ